MKIQFNTDKNIEGTEKLEAFVSEKITHALKRFDDKITRMEVHLADLNAEKGGARDIHCTMEARVKGIQPVVVDSKNESQETALASAIDKMKSALTTIVGKMGNS